MILLSKLTLIDLGADDKAGDAKKRKPKGTLVNPYIKKRKIAGAKF